MSVENTKSYVDNNPYKDRKIFNGYDWVPWACPCDPKNHDCNKCEWELKEGRCITRLIRYTPTYISYSQYASTECTPCSYTDIDKRLKAHQDFMKGTDIDNRNIFQKLIDRILNGKVSRN